MRVCSGEDRTIFYCKQSKCKKCALYFRLVANQYHSEEKPPSIRRLLLNRCLTEIIQTNQFGFGLVKIGQLLKQSKCKKCALYFPLVANQFHSEEKPPSILRLCFSIGQWLSFIQPLSVKYQKKMLNFKILKLISYILHEHCLTLINPNGEGVDQKKPRNL